MKKYQTPTISDLNSAKIIDKQNLSTILADHTDKISRTNDAILAVSTLINLLKQNNPSKNDAQ